MLSQLIFFLENEISDFISSKRDSSFEIVLGPPKNKEDLKAIGNDGKTLLLINIVNLVEEVFGGVQANGNSTTLNVKIMISVYNEDNYLDSLGYLSDVISFFTKHSTFTPESGPGIEGLMRLNFKVFNIPDNDLSTMFLSMGVEKLPSVIYECRLATINTTLAPSLKPNQLSGW
ncbi:Pvc16 family protein [Flammeovirga kamogawensis]|uniref:DUF4255 domain-containing protein n=1 Tax=Flammeovirga kamogawensis TaxID=373891 RepID=A0ABX8GXW6_9BACT|nr:Pvc16 family protein [Flammeovirga kamogawensis]MBB6458873.1 hypothetical protein [Flammeovirga kamogawensis]QWG08454.1 DUF4255 domain-containing protein [Flammeovirga kamogawensis]TRX66750.1 DUF4255 domain-containing protein [Flammeovirga kamogawensis]